MHESLTWVFTRRNIPRGIAGLTSSNSEGA
jgi:hypothetical protein